MASRTVVVMVTGATPGLGKSTLTRGLADLLRDSTDWSVTVSPEEDMGHHAAFSEVVDTFHSTGQASLAQLLRAAHAHLQDCVEDGTDVVVQDMWLPYLPSLLAWGYDDDTIVSFFASLADVPSGIELIQVHVSGDAESALSRAAEREGKPWLRALMAKVSAYPAVREPVEGWPALVAYFAAAEARTIRLLERTPWRTVVVEVRDAPDDVARAAFEALHPLV